MAKLDPQAVKIPPQKATNFRRHIARAAFVRATEKNLALPKLFRSFNITKDEILNYNEDSSIKEATNILLSSLDIADLFDSRYIRDLIRQILKSYFDSGFTGDSLEEVIRNLANTDEDWRILLPVSGIGQTDWDLRIDGIHFRRADETLIEELATQIHERLLGSRPAVTLDSVLDLLKPYKNECLAESFQSGTRTRALEKATAKTRSALDSINYFGLMYVNTFQHQRLGLKGDFVVDRTNHKALVLSSGTQTPGFMSQETSQVNFDLDLDRRFLKHAQGGGFSRLLAWGGTPINDYQQAIKKAIGWFVSGVKSDNFEIRFVHSIIGLELLLCTGDKEDIAERVSAYVAILLAADNDSRYGIKRTIKKYYDQRSRVVHDGESSITIEDIQGIEYYFKSLIKRLLTCPVTFKSLAAFRNYLHRRSVEIGLTQDPQAEPPRCQQRIDNEPEC